MPSFLVRIPATPGVYGEVQAISVSTGSADAGKAVILGADGKVHVSMLSGGGGSAGSLQDAYNGGPEAMLTTVLGPVTLRVQSTLDAALVIKDSDGDPQVRMYGNGQVVAEHYSGSKLISLGQNISNILVDSMPSDKFRAIQYMYTIKNSDASGYETGKISIIHDGDEANIYHEMNGSIGVSSGMSFSTVLNGTSLELHATTDNSPFSRLVHLFKVALS